MSNIKMKKEDIRIGEFYIAGEFATNTTGCIKPIWASYMRDYVGKQGSVFMINESYDWIALKFEDGNAFWYHIDDIHLTKPSNNLVKIPHSLVDEYVNFKNFIKKGDVFIHKELKLIICLK